jgi:hypothetical protein
MISSRMATKEEILLIYSTKFYELIESTKTLSKRDLNKLEGKLRSVEYTNVIKFYFNRERKNILINY